MTPDVFLTRIEEVRRLSRGRRPRVKVVDLRYGVPLIELADGRSFYSYNTCLEAYWKKAAHDT